MDYIAANFDKRLKINELADRIGVNRSYLTSSFKKSLGCSPQEYLMNLRIEKAKTLLKNGDIQVSEVAAKVGYGDPAGFFQGIQGKNRKKSERIQGRKEKTCSEGEKRGLYGI